MAVRCDDARRHVPRSPLEFAGWPEQRDRRRMHRRGDAYADGRAVRAIRRIRVGTVERGVAHRRIGPPSLPPLRTGRLRRRQGVRMPDDTAGRARPRCAARAARRDQLTMRIAIIRQRYTSFGGAERFVENALEALLERDVAITLYTREWPQTKLALIEPSIVDPFYLGSLWRDWGF